MWNPFKKKDLTLVKRIKLAEDMLHHKIPKQRKQAIRDLHWVEGTYEPYFRTEMNRLRRKHYKVASLIRSCEEHLVWIDNHEKEIKEKLCALKEIRQRIDDRINFRD